jgi:hypothetical protein
MVLEAVCELEARIPDLGRGEGLSMEERLRYGPRSRRQARRRRPGHGEEQSVVSCCWARPRRATAQARCSGVSWNGASGGDRQGLQLP